MAKSKLRKGHKKRVAARNLKISQKKKSMEKAQKEFLMDLIKKEQEKGAFENTESVDGKDDVSINEVQGPQI